MTSDQIKMLTDDITDCLQQARAVSEENNFLKRVLKQAVLSGGGRLTVDPSLGEEAKNEKRGLCFGGGEITLK